MSAAIAFAKRNRQVSGAFLWLGYTESLAYPLALVLGYVITPATRPFLYHFIAQLVENTAAIGNDYYTFVMLGTIVRMAMQGPMSGFSRELDLAIQQGRLESYLVQPISWNALPFGLAIWPTIQSLIMAAVIMLAGLALGLQIEWASLHLGLLVILLGIGAAHAIGVLAASVRLISKRSDPVIALYTLATSLLSGELFPVQNLPAFLRPLSYILPQTYTISAIRRVLMPNGDELAGPSFGTALGVLVAINVILYTIALYSFRTSLNFGRRYGVLGGY